MTQHQTKRHKWYVKGLFSFVVRSKFLHWVFTIFTCFTWRITYFFTVIRIVSWQFPPIFSARDQRNIFFSYLLFWIKTMQTGAYLIRMEFHPFYYNFDFNYSKHNIVKLLGLLITVTTRKGWCPRTGEGLRFKGM